MIDINTYDPYIYCEEVREELNIIVSNLESFFPNNDIPSEIFCHIWNKVGIINYEELMYVLKELKLQHVKNYIFVCQEHINIDMNDYDEDPPSTEDKLNHIIENFTHIKYIDIDDIIDFNINIIEIPQVRDISFQHELSSDEVIDIFVKHIHRWKGKVSIHDCTKRLSYNNGKIKYIERTYPGNGIIGYTKLNYSLQQLAKLKPEVYVVSSDSINDTLFALLLPSVNRILFDHIPSKYRLSDLLIKSTLLDIVDTNLSNDKVYQVLSGIYNPHTIINPKKSKIKHILFEKIWLESDVKNVNMFTSISDRTTKYFKTIKTDGFTNLIFMRVPIEVYEMGKWKNIIPNVKTYVSYNNMMIKYYSQREEFERDTYNDKYKGSDIRYI